MKRIAYIGLGSNQGDVAEALNSRDRVAAFDRADGVRRGLAVLSFAPIDATGPDYLNAVVKVETLLRALVPLLHLLDIELMLGRKRRQPQEERAAQRRSRPAAAGRHVPSKHAAHAAAPATASARLRSASPARSGAGIRVPGQGPPPPSSNRSTIRRSNRSRCHPRPTPTPCPSYRSSTRRRSMEAHRGR